MARPPDYRRDDWPRLRPDWARACIVCLICACPGSDDECCVDADKSTSARRRARCPRLQGSRLLLATGRGSGALPGCPLGAGPLSTQRPRRGLPAARLKQRILSAAARGIPASAICVGSIGLHLPLQRHAPARAAGCLPLLQTTLDVRSPRFGPVGLAHRPVSARLTTGSSALLPRLAPARQRRRDRRPFLIARRRASFAPPAAPFLSTSTPQPAFLLTLVASRDGLSLRVVARGWDAIVCRMAAIVFLKALSAGSTRAVQSMDE